LLPQQTGLEEESRERRFLKRDSVLHAMRWTILGSGGCAVIPKPLCRCRVCRQAREKGVPYSRSGPSAFLHDINLLIDTPAEIVDLLNRWHVWRVDYLVLTHLDPDHVEGLRVVEQIALDFRNWRGYPKKAISLIIPEQLKEALRQIRSCHGSLIDFYQESGFVRIQAFRDRLSLGEVRITAIPIDRGDLMSFVYAFEKSGRRVVYAPCDIKPFPEHRDEVQRPDLLIIQPGRFEDGLKHRFKYPRNHPSRTTLYSFNETVDLAKRLQAKRTLFVHLEEYWNRTHDDYSALESRNPSTYFAHDGMRVIVK
jgi:phosphoribosyl 1,2-cyclic phosphate phosphodiesterase